MKVLGLLAGGMLIASAAMSSPAAATNLVFNGGFEAGFGGSGSFSGWSREGDLRFLQVEGSSGVTSPFEGENMAAFGARGAAASFGEALEPNILSQSVSVSAGQAYRVRFSAAASGPFGQADFFSASINGKKLDANVLQSLSAQVSAGQWTTHTFEWLADTSSADLRFEAVNSNGFFYLDSVSISAVPEPSSWLMLIGGFASVGSVARARRRANRFAR